MLALRVEQGGRGLDEVERQRKEATAAWQDRQLGRPASQERRVNIREKISQWEVRSQQGSSQDAGVKAHPPTRARTFSADLLGNGRPSESSRESHSRAKSVDLDFRESPPNAGLRVVGRKSEPLKKCSTPFSTTTPGKQTLPARTFTCSKVEPNNTFSTANSVFSATESPKVEWISDGEKVSKPLPPPSADDQDDNMPAGNFYTSRGFWRKLEGGDRLRWENGRSSAGEAPPPPPKPQRTFEYCGASEDKTGHTAQWDNRSTYNHNSNRSNTKSRRVARPPNFPPPPCPVSKGEGLSRHKKNR